jgi:mono/diheme cytochrome c family protein
MLIVIGGFIYSSKANEQKINSTNIKYVPRPISNNSRKGKVIYQHLNCQQCHSIDGQGGCLAPPLDAEGARRSEDFIFCRLSKNDEAKNRLRNEYGFVNELMPHKQVSSKQARLLAAYLMTLPSSKCDYVIDSHDKQINLENENIQWNDNKSNQEASIKKGAIVYNKLGCAACHAIGSVGGYFAPRLDGIGLRKTKSYIIAHITDAKLHSMLVNTQEKTSSITMPKFQISPDEIRAVSDFLMSLPEEK